MGIVTFPSLSLDGWMTNKSTLLEKVFNMFLAADYSQSNTFKGDVASLKYILSQNLESEETKTEIAKALTKLYQYYFDTINADVSYTEDQETGIITYFIELTATSVETVFELSRTFDVNNQQIANFENSLNEIYED